MGRTWDNVTHRPCRYRRNGPGWGIPRNCSVLFPGHNTIHIERMLAFPHSHTWTEIKIAPGVYGQSQPDDRWGRTPGPLRLARTLFSGPPSCTARDHGRKRVCRVRSVCAGKRPPECCPPLADSIATGPEPDPAPQPSADGGAWWVVVILPWDQHGGLVGWAWWGLTPLDVGLLECSPPSTLGADLMCIQSRVPTWVSQALGSICEGHGCQSANHQPRPRPLRELSNLSLTGRTSPRSSDT